MKKLLAAGAPLNQSSARFRTPLLGASRNGSVEFIELLLDQGARINDYYEYTSLSQWDKEKRLSFSSELTRREYPMTQAAMYGNRDALDTLLQRGADVNATYHSAMTALMLVVDDGAHEEEVVNERYRIDLDRYLQEKSKEENISALNAFVDETKIVEKPKAPRSSGNTGPIREVTSLDIEVGGNPNSAQIKKQIADEKKRLKLKRITSRIDMMKILIEAGADVNRQDDIFGFSPLMQAIRVGDPDAVTLLLDAGARLDLQDNTGKTPLDHAGESANVAIQEIIMHAAGKTY